MSLENRPQVELFRTELTEVFGSYRLTPFRHTNQRNDTWLLHSGQDVVAVVKWYRWLSGDAITGLIETVLPGVVDLVASLPPYGWAVVTSGTKVVTEARMVAAGLPRPPVLVTAEDVQAGKPDPAPYRIAAERLDLDPADCLAVEDAPAGLASAQAAGCVTLALLTTHRREELDADLITVDLTGVRIDRKHAFHVSVL